MLGEKIRACRKSMKRTQMDVALDAGVTTTTISALENGAGDPYLSTVQKVLDTMGFELAIVKKGECDEKPE